ncbi:ABC transporter ATP-binding protein [Trueperella abortisuis]|uniref:Teichoic acid transport system ATP-binding protein n=1 Tax=Trueperella abortisuis TaxID=445930 RepID=A0ABT9PK89_9ACTO|nr:ABC transporter ATP-binding protein [Trueperella abortisuis]MDP9832876.1 teichoic acid transport system ATP-binding protein [Trueperella abortisuis]
MTVNVSIIVNNVSVNYLTSSSDPRQRKNAPLNQKIIGRLLGRTPKVLVPAVKDVSFVTYEGDFIGLLGANGAGKSTLLRVLSGGEPPSSGVVYAQSRPSLLGVNGALLPELSGIENATLGLLALGFTPKEAEERLPEIEDFCSIGDAIYRPMKTYSSGMAARLRFAISTAARPDILLIDEALSTGDSTFQRKSEERMNAMLEDTGTIFLVSHSAQMIERMCNRAIWMHNGSIVTDGEAKRVSAWYQQWSVNVSNHDVEAANKVMAKARYSYQPVSFFPAGTKYNKVAYQPRHRAAR